MDNNNAMQRARETLANTSFTVRTDNINNLTSGINGTSYSQSVKHSLEQTRNPGIFITREQSKPSNQDLEKPNFIDAPVPETQAYNDSNNDFNVDSTINDDETKEIDNTFKKIDN